MLFRFILRRYLHATEKQRGQQVQAPDGKAMPVSSWRADPIPPSKQLLMVIPFDEKIKDAKDVTITFNVYNKAGKVISVTDPITIR